MKDVLVIIGPGAMGAAIARRVGAGKHVLVADLRALAEQAAAVGVVKGLVHAAGASPSMSRPELIVRVDLYGGLELRSSTQQS